MPDCLLFWFVFFFKKKQKQKNKKDISALLGIFFPYHYTFSLAAAASIKRKHGALMWEIWGSREKVKACTLQQHPFG